MKLSGFDGFAKFDSSIKNETRLGGLMTVVVSLTLVYLSLSEFLTYLSPVLNYEFLVDVNSRSNSHPLAINLDVTIAMKCDFIRSDLLDSSGDSITLDSTFVKTQSIWDVHSAKNLANKSLVEQISVKKAIAASGKNIHNSYQDQKSGMEACRIQGSAEVRKVSGMLHFTALGYGISI